MRNQAQTIVPKKPAHLRRTLKNGGEKRPQACQSMVNVRVRGFAVFGDILSAEELVIGSDAETVVQLIAHLSKSVSRKLEDVLLNSATGEIQRGKKILVNGRDVESLQGLATRLKEGDHVVFFPPVGGG